MVFGIFCNNISDHNVQVAENLIKTLIDRKHEFIPGKDLNAALKNPAESTFNKENKLPREVQVLITIGGDGTILSAIPMVVENEVPLLGINTGRLGFLSSITISELDQMLDEIESAEFRTEQRAMLEAISSESIDIDSLQALNEISILKKDSSSMIIIHAELDGEFLNTYWADGLIISTATGSTAYSLSCGGPIVAPGSGNLIITPIAPHNLNVRPFVVPDSSSIKLKFETRSGDLLIALDSASTIIKEHIEIEVRKSDKSIQLIRPRNYSYLETLRNKMIWGQDKRN